VVNGVSYSIGGTALYFQVVDIPNAGPYTITITISAADTVQIALTNR